MGGLFGGGGGQSISTVDPVALGLRIQTSAYGLVVPIVYGKTRVTGNLLGYYDFTPVAHTTTTSSGGGGGKGGGGGDVSSSQTSWTYTASFVLGICEGQMVGGVKSWWADKDYYANSAPWSVFNGTYPQTPWDYLVTNHPDQALGYQGIGYVACAAYDLGAQTSLPNHSFEVVGALPFNAGTIDDANPKDIVVDFLTNSHYGAGFPSSKIGDLTAYSNYCVANGIFLSPAYTDQAAAQERLTALFEITNSAPYYSENKLKVVPYGDSAATGNGATFTPNTTPLYDLTDDDFIAIDGEAPVRLLRNSTADAYNKVQVEFVNRANQYNVEPMPADDQANIETFGPRPKDPVKAHEIADPSVARTVAQLILQRNLYIRNTYEFQVGWKYCLLEPTDLVTITDPGLFLDKHPVRITSIEEDQDGMLTIQAEDAPAGVYSSAKYPSQASSRYAANFNESAGDTNPPVIFEAPDTLTTTGFEVWVGASGGPIWGGAQVWISQDGNSYKQIGVISNPARQGVIAAAMAAGTDPDSTHTLSVDMTMSRGELGSVSQVDCDAFASLCYVDGELIAYRDATLTASNKYNLNYLRRGVYGTAIGAHSVGKQFSRIDGAFFRYPFTADQIGKKLYVKLPSFNVWGGGVQGLADVTPVTYTITGSALQSPLPDLTGVGTNYVSGMQQGYWDAVDDFRQPNVDYEIRTGPTWASASVLGSTPLTHFTFPTNGTYWIAAHYMTSGGANAYSSNPTEVIVTGASLDTNVIATFDEAATGWSGARTNLNIVSGQLQLAAAGNILTATDFLGIGNVLWYGGVASSGVYELPAGHAVNIGRVAPCQVGISYSSRGQSIYDNVLTINDFLAATDLLGATLGPKVGVQPQIAIAMGDGVYGPWQNYAPGVYNGQYFKARIVVASSDPQVTAYVSALNFSVDVPDRLDPYQVTTSASGVVHVTYSAPFNGGSGAGGLPLVQGTILGASANDDLQITNQTLTGCDVAVVNGGSRVVRSVNIQVQGY